MYADCLIPLSVQKKTFCCTRDTYKTSCTENGVVVYAALIMAQENLSRPYHRKERPFWKSASADRPGPGFCPGKVGKRLTEGPHERRGGAAARCRRHRSSGDARRRHRRNPHTRTPPNGLTKKCSSEHRCGRGTLQCKVGKRLEHRRGSGIRPVKKAGPAARGRPLNFAVTGGYYSSTIGLYLGTRAFMMLHAST